MVPASAHDFYLATAGASAALVGLMFVAISVSARNPLDANAGALDRVRASSALIALVSPLLMSLIALLPGDGLGFSSAAVAALGILYSASALRRLASAVATRRDRVRSVLTVATFLAVLGVELAFGLQLTINPDDRAAVNTISATLIASLGLGISHAWELVGGQATSALASISGLLRHDESNPEPLPETGKPSPSASPKEAS